MNPNSIDPNQCYSDTSSYDDLFTTQILQNKRGISAKVRAAKRYNFMQMPSANIKREVANHGNYGKPGFFARTQEREDTNAGHIRYGVTSVDGKRQQQYMYDKARATIKDSTPHNDKYGTVTAHDSYRQQQYLQDKARSTIKDSTPHNDKYGTAFAVEAQRAQQYLMDKARSTIKDSTPHNDKYGTAFAVEAQRAQQYLMDKARSTVRQTTHVVDYRGGAGPADTFVQRSRTAEENALITDLKEVTLKRDRMAGPQKYRIVNGVQSINMALKNKESYGWGAHQDCNGTPYKDPRFHKNRTPVNTQIWHQPKGKEFYNLTTDQVNRPQNQERGPEDYQIAALQSNPFNISVSQGAQQGSLFY